MDDHGLPGGAAGLIDLVGGRQMKALAADDPRVIGEYRLRGRIGSGGMGRVYLGLSPAGRAVAVKVVQPNLAQDAEFLRRFQQEVALAKAVSGIYTAPVVASGLQEDPPWLATAFVPGPSLAQVVTDHGPLSEASLWPLLGGLVEALAAIHACGVVHRDLKPANVLLATDGPRVIDFGISRAADGISLTATGVVFGTPGYVSPEQAEGKPSGPASDMFALGCVIAYAARGAGPVRRRDRGQHPVSGGALRPGPGSDPRGSWHPGRARGTRAAAGGACCLPGQGPGRAAHAAVAVRGDRSRDTRKRAVRPWPSGRGPVTSIIATYQARVRAGDAGVRCSRGRATLVHPPTTLPAGARGVRRRRRGSGSGWSPQSPAPRLPRPRGRMLRRG